MKPHVEPHVEDAAARRGGAQVRTRHLRPEDLRGKRWAGWLRESTEDQADAVVRQRADIERAAAELGLVGPTWWYSRVGTGEAVAMPELEEALEDGRRGEYDVLVVYHTSRMGRNRAEVARQKAAFQKAGIVIYFAAQRMISGSVATGPMEGILEALDEYDNEQRRLWIAGGVRERQKAGRWSGAVPFGYRRALEDRPDGTRGYSGELEPDPEEAPIVARILTSEADSATMAAQLNEAGFTLRGRPFTSQNVRRTRQNPVYRGDLVRYRLRTSAHYWNEDDPHDGRRTIAGVVPALV